MNFTERKLLLSLKKERNIGHHTRENGDLLIWGAPAIKEKTAIF